METLKAALPLVAQHPHHSAAPELRKWTERLLIEGCLLSSQLAASRGQESAAAATNLAFFRNWARFWEEQPGQGLVTVAGPSAKAGMPRRYIWRLYFETLSTLLQQGWPDSSSVLADNSLQSPVSPVSPPLPSPASPSFPTQQAQASQVPTKLQTRIELQRVETIYEGLLLREVRFPKANESSEEVREWVELVMGNWNVLCGSTWQNADLGEGAKEGVSRSVLDVSRQRCRARVTDNVDDMHGRSFTAPPPSLSIRPPS